MTLQIGPALLWGLFATGVLSIVMAGSQALGWSRISLPFVLGAMFSGRRDRAMVLGFTVHLLFGLVFGLAYALVFEAWNRATWWLGVLLGLYHGAFMLIVVMPLLPSVHPRMAGRHHGPDPTRQLEPPGFLAINYGRRTPLITLAAHLAYGAILGAFYPAGG